MNSDRKESCRCCRADVGGETRCTAEASGLWSVKSVKGRPSSKDLKCFTVAKAARSSRSKDEYFSSAVLSFLEKNASGAHAPGTRCWSQVAVDRAALAALKAIVIRSVHTKSAGFPRSPSVSGRKMAAAAGTKRRK